MHIVRLVLERIGNRGSISEAVSYISWIIICMQVLIWKGKVDRACIERLRGFGTPPVLVGQVMEMVMILIGKRLPSQRLYETRELTGKEEMSSRMSSSSSSTRIGIKKGGSIKRLLSVIHL